MQEIAAVVGTGRGKSPPGLPAQFRAAREAKGLTWYAVAKLAGIPNSSTVRDIEAGRGAQLSNVTAVAQVLGMRLDLVNDRIDAHREAHAYNADQARFLRLSRLSRKPAVS